MIKQVKSKLSVKMFLFTMVILSVCGVATYSFLAYFTPYIYIHSISEVEFWASELSREMTNIYKNDAVELISTIEDILEDDYKDEFKLHIFDGKGKELSLPKLEEIEGKCLKDYESVEKLQYKVSFIDDDDDYILIMVKNMKKRSQIQLSLKKAFPPLCMVMFLFSIVVSFFYSIYFTAPIKKLNIISKKMAEMDFSELCKTGRTDEIGGLSGSLNEMSVKLSDAISELMVMNEKLQEDIQRERMLEKQRLEFFSAVSHELKTPITIMKGQLQGMIYGVGRYKDRETYLLQSLKETESLENMVQELLTVTRLETPGYICNKRAFDFSRFITDRVLVFEDLFLQRELQVQKFIEPDINVTGDIQLLEKVVDNLLSNARAYTNARETIYVRLTQNNDSINLSIENTGIWIPEESLPQIFEPFYRVEQSRSKQTGGSGLGLYIAKTILELHDGNIELYNSEKGVQVKVIFYK